MRRLPRKTESLPYISFVLLNDVILLWMLHRSSCDEAKDTHGSGCSLMTSSPVFAARLEVIDLIPMLFAAIPQRRLSVSSQVD